MNNRIFRLLFAAMAFVVSACSAVDPNTPCQYMQHPDTVGPERVE
jgi:hypothetical protein